MMKHIIVPVAAFAVTATAASAFGPSMLQKLDIELTETQVEALEEARKLHREGNVEAAQEVLEEAGLDEDILDQIRDMTHEQRDAVRAAIEAGDYDLFTELVTEGPLAEAITSESDFELLVEAHQLMADGDREGAEALFDQLGLERREGGPRGKAGGMLSSDARDALEAHDYTAFMAAIADTPLADRITTEEQFDTFVEAQTLIEAGDRDAAHVLLEDADLAPERGMGDSDHNGRMRHNEDDEEDS